jgi:type I restriction enzyme S subunit
MRTVSGVGGSLLRARPAYVAEIKIPLPPLAEQRRIAEVLDRADALRAKRRAALAQLDFLTQALFFDLFGDPVTNSKGLRIEPLGEHLLFITSGGRGWAQFYTPNGSRFIRSLDVQMNYIGDDDVVLVAAPDNAEAHRTRVQVGDVLLTITGSRIGRVAPVPPQLEGSYVSQHVAILRVDSKHIEPDFLSFFLSLGVGGQRQIARAQYGQTKPGLNFEQIRRVQIPVPPTELQNEFADQVAAVEKLKTVQRTSLAELDALFASLQHHAFRGEL